MQNKISNKHTETSPDATEDSPKRLKLHKLPKLTVSTELSNLSEYHREASPLPERTITVESVTDYFQRLVQNIYADDPLKLKQLIQDFIQNNLPKIRQKIQQRLSLLNYLCESLKYKQFSQIQIEMQKEWRKNLLLMSVNTIWTTRMINHKFTNAEQFFTEYKKHIAIVANLTNYYFQNTLALLNNKKIPTFLYIQQSTAHHIVNNLEDWYKLYHEQLICLLMRKNFEERNEVYLDFDVQSLHINPKYMEVNSKEEQLPETIKAIKSFSEQHTINGKIQKLKEVRATFLKQIEQSRQKLQQKHNYKQSSPLEKDDIIGCMIYCIVKGNLYHIQVSLQALSEMLGINNQLLSRKGVDSYRADLESAVQYLCEENQPSLITIPEDLKSKSA